MEFGTLALITAAGLLGPLLAVRKAWLVPIVLGELVAGIVLGHTGFQILDPSEPTFSFLADIGFALVMFVAGSHVPLRDPRLLKSLSTVAIRLGLTIASAALIAVLVARAFDLGHWALYLVLMASSSAALALPVIGSLGLTGRTVNELLPQIAIADALCIIALPMAIDHANIGRVALGSLVVLIAGAVACLALWRLEVTGVRRRVHVLSENRKFALELRISTMVLFGLCALAAAMGVSIMLAGFVMGLGLAAIGNPRRLAKQLFAITEGFFGPIFFLSLGASLDLRLLGAHPAMLGLGCLLAAGAVVAHASCRLAGQPLAAAGVAAAQLGLPLAALKIGESLGYFVPGEAGAIMLAALLLIGVTTASAAVLARRQRPGSGPPEKVTP